MSASSPANSAGGAMLQPGTRDASPAIVPQKRALNDENQQQHQYSTAIEDMPANEGAARVKKESLKKRDAKGNSEARATPDPKTPKKPKGKPNTAPVPIRHMLAPPRLIDFEPPSSVTFTPHHTITGPDRKEIDFNETTEHVRNKKSYRYTHCIADPAFPSFLWYRLTDAKPYGPRLSFEDQAAQLYMDTKGKQVTTDKGFRMARANVCVREGRFYYECKITSGIPKKGQTSEGHVRIGWARREATLDAPCGFDAYSYGLRDVGGQKVHLSRPQDFFPKSQNIEVGDVIGLEINLPSETLHRKIVEGKYNPAVDRYDEEEERKGVEAGDIIRDRIPIRHKNHLYFEQVDYAPTKELEDLMNPVPQVSTSGIIAAHEKPSPNHPSPALRTLPGSNIKVYRNGVYVGEPFTDLLAFLPPASKPAQQPGSRDGLDDGMIGYYPAISVFRGGAVDVNFGPDFWFPIGSDADDDEVDMVGNDQPPPADKVSPPRPLSERYEEQIAEDVVWDIVDEVDFWAQDGFMESKQIPKNLASEGDGTIKELLQDDE